MESDTKVIVIRNVKKPVISVIVPALNEEKYIEPTLQALRSQDYKGKYEIIVADGGSKDRTVRIAKKYADRVVKVKKRGVAAGRNGGAKIAKGNILLFVDADTILLYNTMSKMQAVFKRKNTIGAACTVLPISSKALDILLYLAFNKFAANSLKVSKKKAGGMCCMYKKDAFDKVGGFDERLKTLEDIDLSKRISKLGDIEFVNDTLALTSPRRIEKWGKNISIRRYLTMYIKYLLTGNGDSGRRYKPVR